MAETYIVRRETTIDATADQIYPLLADFHHWTTWSPWEGLDPDMQRTYSGADSGVGAAYAWTGNRKAGAGTMEVTDATEPSRVMIDLAFLKPFKSRSITTFDLAQAGDVTTVTWTMTGPKTLMTKVMGLFTSMDRMIGPDFEKGLAQLKTEAEGSDT